MIKKTYNKPGLTVKVHDNNLDKAMRVLKNKLQQDGIFNKLREKEFFMSKGEKGRRAKAAGRRRLKKDEEKRLEEHGF